MSKKLKTKIEITQADYIELLVSKIQFLKEEYNNLYSSFTQNKGKVKTDIERLTISYHSYLSEVGDINRILSLHSLFKDEDTQEKE
jgi:hypothetical protein